MTKPLNDEGGSAKRVTITLSDRHASALIRLAARLTGGNVSKATRVLIEQRLAADTGHDDRQAA